MLRGENRLDPIFVSCNENIYLPQLVLVTNWRTHGLVIPFEMGKKPAEHEKKPAEK